jgi:hypothetical protein
LEYVMRLLIDSLTAVTLAGLLAGLLMYYRHQESEDDAVAELRANVEVIRQELMVQTALERVARNEYGNPESIDPEWFEEELPRNVLLGSRYPWLEIASGEELKQDNPTHKVAADESQAGFWYNPRKGLVRARIPQYTSDKRTLEVYNFVNRTNLASLLDDTEPDPVLDEKSASAATSLWGTRRGSQQPAKRKASRVHMVGGSTASSSSRVISSVGDAG